MKISNVSNQQYLSWTSKASNNQPKYRQAKKSNIKKIPNQLRITLPCNITVIKEAHREGMSLEDIANKFDVKPLIAACILADDSQIDYSI